jgi:hypothetical protein
MKKNILKIGLFAFVLGSAMVFRPAVARAQEITRSSDGWVQSCLENGACCLYDADGNERGCWMRQNSASS